MFHHFHDARHPPGQGSIDAEDFAEMIEAIGRDRFLPARDWMTLAINDKLRPDSLCLTFDDNLRCQFDIALPVLEDFGLTAFWFVYTSVNTGKLERLEIYRDFRCTQFAEIDHFYDAFDGYVTSTVHSERVDKAMACFDPAQYLAGYSYLSDSDRRFRFIRDRILGKAHYEEIMDGMLIQHSYDLERVAARLWMTDTHLRRLHDTGHIVGLHSQTHPTNLAALSVLEQTAEYTQNRTYLEDILGEIPRTMSHPNNSYDADTLALLTNLNVELGFRADPSKSDFGQLEHPRHNHAVLHELIRNG